MKFASKKIKKDENTEESKSAISKQNQFEDIDEDVDLNYIAQNSEVIQTQET